MQEQTMQPTILVVEDDPSMLEIISILLEDEGYGVWPAHDGQHALVTLEGGRPNLIISDVIMPGMDGFDFYERVRSREEWAQIPFIFLTAKGQSTDVRRGMGLGADDYLTKPFEPEDLLSAVKVRLARAAETQAAIDKAGSDLTRQIVRTLTHEFRTPLALVAGYTDLLEASGQSMSEEARQSILRGLHSGARRLSGLVEDFLLLNRLGTGELALEVGKEQRTTSGPDWAVDLVVDEFRDGAAERNVTITTQLGAPDATVAVAHRHTTEMLSKLVDNAIKFSKRDGGQVVITTREEEGSWVFQIVDHGIGIRPDALPWIFDAFRQVDRDRMEQQGAGIGLAIVRGLASVYRGRVEVKSVPDQGSTFTLWLPLVGE